MPTLNIIPIRPEPSRPGLLILFLLLLRAPASALAEQTYDLSCEDVKKVLIVRMPNGWLDIHALKAFFIPSPSAHGLRGKNNYSIS